MFIRNVKQRMNGLSVGAWNGEVNPDRVIKEVIRNRQMFLGSALVSRVTCHAGRGRVARPITSLSDDPRHQPVWRCPVKQNATDVAEGSVHDSRHSHRI